MTVLVIDASVLVVALGDDGLDGDRAQARLRGEDLAAPELIDWRSRRRSAVRSASVPSTVGEQDWRWSTWRPYLSGERPISCC